MHIDGRPWRPFLLSPVSVASLVFVALVIVGVLLLCSFRISLVVVAGWKDRSFLSKRWPL
jgi:hypothetical protein